MSEDSGIQARDIANLINGNIEFEQLSGELNQFNPIQVLGVEDQELKHSNVLAWLLYPAGNHNLRDDFVKRFLTSVLMSPVNENIIDEAKAKSNIFEDLPDLLDISSSNFDDLDVFREREQIDLLLVSEKNKLVVCIENKIHSGESDGQLKKYKNTILKNRKYKNFQKLFVFLTLHQDEPSEDIYLVADYGMIIEHIDALITLNENRLQPEVLNFLKHYKKILSMNSSTGNNLEKKARNLYKEHKQVIDYIYEVGNSKDLFPAFEMFCEENNINNKQPYLQRPNFIQFNQNFLADLPKVSQRTWANGLPLVNWFTTTGQHIKYVIEVGPFADDDARFEFLKYLHGADFYIRESSLKKGGTYTRIFSEKSEKVIKDWANHDIVLDVMNKLYNINDSIKFRNKLEKVIDGYNFSSVESID